MRPEFGTLALDIWYLYSFWRVFTYSEILVFTNAIVVVVAVILNSQLASHYILVDAEQGLVCFSSASVVQLQAS